MNDGIIDFGESVYMNAAEAANLWSGITGEEITPELYEARCASGKLEREGVVLRATGGGSWLTDLDSLLAYLDRSITLQHERIKDALEERRLELEGG